MPVAPPFGLAGPRKISGVGDGGGTRALTLYRPELQVCASYASLSDAPFKSWPAAERKSPKIVFCPQLGNGGPDRESADLEAAQTQLSAGMLFDPHLSSLHKRVSTTRRLRVGSRARFRKFANRVSRAETAAARPLLLRSPKTRVSDVGGRRPHLFPLHGRVATTPRFRVYPLRNDHMLFSLYKD